MPHQRHILRFKCIYGCTEQKFKTLINHRKWQEIEVTLSAKIRKLNEIMTKLPPKVIYGAWKESGLVDIEPNLLNKKTEFVHDDSEDEYLKL